MADNNKYKITIVVLSCLISEVTWLTVSKWGMPRVATAVANQGNTHNVSTTKQSIWTECIHQWAEYPPQSRVSTTEQSIHHRVSRRVSTTIDQLSSIESTTEQSMSTTEQSIAVTSRVSTSKQSIIVTDTVSSSWADCPPQSRVSQFNQQSIHHKAQYLSRVSTTEQSIWAEQYPAEYPPSASSPISCCLVEQHVQMAVTDSRCNYFAFVLQAGWQAQGTNESWMEYRVCGSIAIA